MFLLAFTGEPDESARITSTGVLYAATRPLRCRRVVPRMFLASSTLVSGSPILQVTGPNDVTTNFSTLGQNLALAVGFNTSVAFNNAHIEISLAAFDGPITPTLDVFLTSQIGMGTTSANEFARATVTPAVAGSGISAPYVITPAVTVLSGLSLDPGSYFLTVFETFQRPRASGASWVSSPQASALISGVGGVLLTDGFLQAGGNLDTYIPASAFGHPVANDLWFTVTGDLRTNVDPTLPEPTSFFLLGSGLATATCWRRRRPRT